MTQLAMRVRCLREPGAVPSSVRRRRLAII